jgi:hypothetical protein
LKKVEQMSAVAGHSHNCDFDANQLEQGSIPASLVVHRSRTWKTFVRKCYATSANSEMDSFANAHPCQPVLALIGLLLPVFSFHL